MTNLSPPQSVVESYLLGLTSDPIRREAVFKFRTPDLKQEFEMRIVDVEYLSVNEFLKQNIVHQIRVLNDGSDLNEVRNLLANLMFDKRDASEVVETTLLAELDKCSTGVLQGTQVLVEIEPVYGATALVLAASIAWV